MRLPCEGETAMMYTPIPSMPPTPLGHQLPVDKISPRPSLHFLQEPGSLQALAESIRRYGLCRPVTVRRRGNGRYVIVSGNRRLMAVRMLGLPCISACVLADEARWQTSEQLVDALLTRRLHYLEEADALRALHERHGMSWGEMSRLLGMTVRSMMEQMRLTECGDELRAFLMEEGMPMSIALTLLRLPDGEMRMETASRIARERLCVRDAALLVASAQRGIRRNNEVCYREEEKESQNHTQNVIGVIRDQRLYINALRDIAGQMQSSGIRATMTEQQIGGRLEMTISIPLRRRRAARYQSM